MPTPAVKNRPDMRKFYAYRDAALNTRAMVAYEGISDNLDRAAYCMDVSYDLSLTGERYDPIKILKRRARQYEARLSCCTRANGRVQYVLKFPTMAHMLAFKTGYLDGVEHSDEGMIAALVRIDAEYLYCVDPEAPLDSFIDLNPLPVQE